METNSLSVKVLPLPAEISTERSDHEMYGWTNPGLPPTNVINSYPDTVLNVPIGLLEKIKLIDGDSIFIDPPDQKANEAHELHVDNKNEIILTKYALDSAGEPISREMRNVTTKEVSFDNVVKLEQQETKRPLMPWESPAGDDVERKNGISR